MLWSSKVYARGDKTKICFSRTKNIEKPCRNSSLRNNGFNTAGKHGRGVLRFGRTNNGSTCHREH